MPPAAMEAEVTKRIGHFENRSGTLLRQGQHWQKRAPSEYYDTFVDLYLLAMAKCVTYGVGGYGRWASYMSFNSTCAIRHHTFTGIHSCPFVKPPKQQHYHGLDKPIFHLPMPVYTNDTSVSLVKPELPKQPPRSIEKDIYNELSAEEPLFPNIHGNRSSSLWEDSTRLPQWMKDYFAWHSEQRKLVNEENWQSFRYLAHGLFGRRSSAAGHLTFAPYPFMILRQQTQTTFVHQVGKPVPLEGFWCTGRRDGLANPDWLTKQLHAKVTKWFRL
jgi:hypothetical protein